MKPDNLLKGKVCSSCDRELEASVRFFNLDRTNKDGFRYSCRECEKERRNRTKKPIVKSIPLPTMYNIPNGRYSDNYICFEEWPLARTYHRRKKPRT